MSESRPRRAAHPLTWAFHRNTSRWAHNSTSAALDAYPGPPKEYLNAPLIRLPQPLELERTLGELLQERASCRRFAPDPLSLADVATILHATYGIKGRSTMGPLEFLERTVPSAGGLFPLEVYLIARRVDGIVPGVHHYAPLPHALELLREVKLPRALSDYLFMGQRYVTDAAGVLVLTAVLERSQLKYGERGYRYILIEAGHAAQNANLATAALSLGSVNLGGFFDDDLAALLGLGNEEVVLYCIALGRPASGDRSLLRLDPSSAG